MDVTVKRISPPECRWPNAARLASALIKAADTEAALRHRSFHIVVHVWDERRPQSGARRSSYPSGRPTSAYVQSAFVVLGARVAESVVVVAHAAVAKGMDDADMQADMLGVERV